MDPVRPEIEKCVNDAYAVARKRILGEYFEKKDRMQGQLRLTREDGGHLPEHTKWGAEFTRELVLARADAWLEAFALHPAPSEDRTTFDLRANAQREAESIISRIRFEVDLMDKMARNSPYRSKVAPVTRQYYPTVHLDREIQVAMETALSEAMLRLDRQRTEQQLKGNSSPKVLSKRDALVLETIGSELFRSHTNAEIATDPKLRKRLRDECKLQPGEATKASFDRIRRTKGLPLSSEIRNKRSTHK